jgi:hypothetical protein
VAFLRVTVSDGNRREIDVRALPDFGRPRGFNISAAVAALKISSNTSRVLRASAARRSITFFENFPLIEYFPL